MMQIDLTIHIADYLNRFKHVVLPGIGRFDKIHQPAQLRDGVSDLQPPSTRISYDPTVLDDEDRLAAMIADREGISIEQSRGLLQLFADRKLADIMDTGSASIFPLGTLILEGDTMVFTASDNRLTNKYFGLQPLTITPANYTEVEKISSAENNQKTSFDNLITVDKKEKDPIWRWLMIIVAAFVLALLYQKCEPLKGYLGLDDTPSSTGHLTAASSSDTSGSQPPAITADTTMGDLSSKGARQLHIDDLTDGEIDSVLADEELRIAGKDSVINCVIILGSYRQQRNAIRMMSDVETAGHDLYVGVHGDYTRVGVVFNCAKEELVSYLQNIRKQYVSHAWYLVPELHVEYAS